MVIVISHAKEINKTNIIFIETSCHFMNRKSFRNFRGILNIIWLRQQFRYRHVNWCYAADGFVCILRKIFCILYQALVRHNILIHFIFNRSVYAVHWSLAVMSFTVVTIYFHFAVYLRNQIKNISWSDRDWPAHLSLQMCKVTSGGKLCFSRTKSKTLLMHVKAAICKWSLTW